MASSSFSPNRGGSPQVSGSVLNDGVSTALILVIEDESMVLMGYRMLFESWGYRVVAAGSSEEALNLLADHPFAPDVIVADFRLRNGATGLQAIQAVENRYASAIPAILITGDTAAERLREAVASGLPVLHKPVNGRKLQSLLENCLH